MNESAAIIKELQSINALQAQQIILLEEKVMVLLDLLQKQSIKKDSHNSSLPPSSDFFRKTKSLRIPGVLPRIAICYFFASVIFLYTSLRGRILCRELTL